MLSQGLRKGRDEAASVPALPVCRARWGVFVAHLLPFFSSHRHLGESCDAAPAEARVFSGQVLVPRRAFGGCEEGSVAAAHPHHQQQGGQG